MKLGFTADDLSSKERIWKKWGEIAVAKLPEKISFKETPSLSWSKPLKYEQSKAALESLGFRRAGTFETSPQNCVVEFWLNGEPGLFAKIIDSQACGVYSEVTVMTSNGSAVSFENTEECGVKHREPDQWVHCGLVTPDQLLERARQRRPSDATEMSLAECISAYEQALNETFAWRRRVGFTVDDVKRTYERMKKRRSLG